jgi:hypothetical protein
MCVYFAVNQFSEIKLSTSELANNIYIIFQPGTVSSACEDGHPVERGAGSDIRSANAFCSANSKVEVHDSNCQHLVETGQI